MEKETSYRKENNNFKLLDPKNDYVFHALFREKNNRLTEAFLAAVLNEKVKIVKNLDRHLDISKVTEKLGIMDLNVELEDKTRCNVEMQVQAYDGELERFLYYLANSYARQLKRKALYGEINRCINIVVVNHDIEELKDIDDFVTKWVMMDTKTNSKILTNKFELYIIVIPRVIKYYLENRNNKLAHWVMFLLNPYSEEVKAIMSENKDIKEMSDELEYLNGDYEAQRIAELREKAIRDEASALVHARNQGLEQGIEQGIYQGKVLTAKNLLKLGLSIEDISKATGLTKEEIIKFKEE